MTCWRARRGPPRSRSPSRGLGRLHEKQLALLRCKLLNVVLAELPDDLRYELGAGTQLGQKVELFQQTYNKNRLASKPISCNPRYLKIILLVPLPWEADRPWRCPCPTCAAYSHNGRDDGEHKANNPSCPGNTGFIHPTSILPIPAAA